MNKMDNELFTFETDDTPRRGKIASFMHRWNRRRHIGYALDGRGGKVTLRRILNFISK